MTPEEYRAVPAINATAIKAGAKSMLHMHHALTTGKDPTPAMRWGTLLHGQLLQPYAKPVVVYDGVRRGAAWDAFKASHDGAEILSVSEHAKLVAEQADVRNAVQMIRTHPEAFATLDGCQHEHAITWEEPGIGLCKALVDAWKPGTLVEVKTARTIDERGFWSASWSMGYHLQLAWYMRGLRANGHKVERAVVIAQESSAPFDVAVYDADPALLAFGEKECLRIAREYRMAEQRRHFPGAHPVRRQLLPPAWADEQLHGAVAEDIDPSELT